MREVTPFKVVGNCLPYRYPLGIGCDATNEAAVAKVFALKNADLSKKNWALVAWV